MSTLTSGTLYWLNLVLGHEDLDPVETLLMVALVNHVDANDECFPGMETLSSMARTSYGTARRRLQKLEERGYLSRERMRRESGNLSVYRYRLNREAFGEPARNLRDGERVPARTKTRASQRAPRRALASAHQDARAEVPIGEVPIGEVTTCDGKPSDMLTRTAQRLTTEWWDRRKAAGEAPAQSFVGVMQVVKLALSNGVPVRQLAAALDATPTVTAAALEMTLSKLRGKVGRQPPRMSEEAGRLLVDEYERNRNGPPNGRSRGVPLGLPKGER